MRRSSSPLVRMITADVLYDANDLNLGQLIRATPTNTRQMRWHSTWLVPQAGGDHDEVPGRRAQRDCCRRPADCLRPAQPRRPGAVRAADAGERNDDAS